ncbi:hypothetical protein [Streptomyces drozdowiczii]|uniref:hypothetical protein n=1 Tax=Streptomyces drozdowiczii TaxID=202862 RepID=UPI00403D3608
MTMPEESKEVRLARIDARVTALMLVALDGQTQDVEPLLDDLSAEDVGDVVHSLASVSLLSMMPRGRHDDPDMRARLGAHLRARLLERQARAAG